MSIKVIAFDLFGTVFDMSGVDRAEIRAYLEHIKKPEWSPLVLPDSWRKMKPFPDAREGFKRLTKQYLTTSLSNAPITLQCRLFVDNYLSLHFLTPLEMLRVYKTDPRAYLSVCDLFSVEPSEVMMVTANKDFGDLEAAEKLGMTPMLIRGETGPKTIIELAEQLGCLVEHWC